MRELENRVRRAVLVARDRPIEPEDLDLGAEAPPQAESRGGSRQADAPPERRRIEEALVRADGVVARAAEALGLSRQVLYRKMARLGIELERRPKS